MSEVNGGPAQLVGDDAAAAAALARHDAAVAHAEAYRCPECAAVAAVDRGTWVRVIHGACCSRRRLRGPAVRVGRRRRLAACVRAGRSQPPSVQDVAPAETEAAEPQPKLAARSSARDGGVRHANRSRHRGVHRRRRASHSATADLIASGLRSHGGVRSGRWFVSGARVWAWIEELGDWVLGTARRLVGTRRRCVVKVVLDEPVLLDDDTELDMFALADLWAAA